MIRITFKECNDKPFLAVWDVDHVPRVGDRVYLDGPEPKRITYDVNSVTWTSPMSVDIYVSWVNAYV